jgi:hypothetical protein
MSSAAEIRAHQVVAKVVNFASLANPQMNDIRDVCVEQACGVCHLAAVERWAPVWTVVAIIASLFSNREFVKTLFESLSCGMDAKIICKSEASILIHDALEASVWRELSVFNMNPAGVYARNVSTNDARESARTELKELVKEVDPFRSGPGGSEGPLPKYKPAEKCRHCDSGEFISSKSMQFSSPDEPAVVEYTCNNPVHGATPMTW